MLGLSSALSRHDPRDHLGSVRDHLAGMKRALAASDSLHEDPGVPIDDDAHAALTSGSLPAAAGRSNYTLQASSTLSHVCTNRPARRRPAFALMPFSGDMPSIA